MSRAGEFGELLAREEGKLLSEATGEVIRAARIFRYFAGEALRRHGRTLDSSRSNVEIGVHREPVGVFGLITPWNFPIAIPAWKMAPALAFGNTVVLKPSSLTPAVAYSLAVVAVESGIPPGVLNVVFGEGEAGQALAGSSSIDGISFTGSQRAGRAVALAACENQVRVQLEMGGKNPLVIMDDADIEAAVAIAIDGGFFQAGQRCTASSRLIVHAAAYDAFVDRLVARTQDLRVGGALDRSSEVGPVSSAEHRNSIIAKIEWAISQGARLVAGGTSLSLDQPGHYLSPAVLLDTNSSMQINNEEVFGPVVSVTRVTSYEEALAAANHGVFGLSAGIVTASLRHAHHFRRNVRAGLVTVNLPTAGVDYHVPFGGTRASSLGPREQGFAAVEFYTQLKTVYSAA